MMQHEDMKRYSGMPHSTVVVDKCTIVVRLHGLCKNGCCNEAVELVEQSKFSMHLFNSLLDALFNYSDFESACNFFEQVRKQGLILNK